MENKNGFLTITDISKIFDISRQAVDGWLVNKRLKFSRIGNTRRIRPEDLIEYLESLGNSPAAMENFKKDIRDYLQEK